MSRAFRENERAEVGGRDEQGQDMTPPDDARALEREELAEHVSEILFDAQSSYDPDCLFCQRATTLGLFAAYGFDTAGDD